MHDVVKLGTIFIVFVVGGRVSKAPPPPHTERQVFQIPARIGWGYK